MSTAPRASSTPRVAGRRLMAFLRLLRSPLGEGLRRFLARRLVRRLDATSLQTPPAFLDEEHK